MSWISTRTRKKTVSSFFKYSYKFAYLHRHTSPCRTHHEIQPTKCRGILLANWSTVACRSDPCSPASILPWNCSFCLCFSNSNKFQLTCITISPSALCRVRVSFHSATGLGMCFLMATCKRRTPTIKMVFQEKNSSLLFVEKDDWINRFSQIKLFENFPFFSYDILISFPKSCSSRKLR